MADVQETPVTTTRSSVTSLPQETLDFAHKMFDAARTGNEEVLIAAVDSGLPINLTNDKGNTLLMLAAYAGHLSLTNALLRRGADPNAQNDLGQSPVAGAVFKGHDDVVRALMNAGANARLGQPSAIQAAHMFGRTELMEVLGTKAEDRDMEVPIPPIREIRVGGPTTEGKESKQD